jgi:hypothetical protein
MVLYSYIMLLNISIGYILGITIITGDTVYHYIESW